MRKNHRNLKVKEYRILGVDPRMKSQPKKKVNILRTQRKMTKKIIKAKKQIDIEIGADTCWHFFEFYNQKKRSFRKKTEIILP